MKKFFIKISGAISAFFQKLSDRKAKKYSDMPILYGPPNSMPSKKNMKRIRKEMAEKRKNSGIQELYGIPPSMLNKIKDDKEDK